jgi:hypothetical protein
MHQANIINPGSLYGVQPRWGHARWYEVLASLVQDCDAQANPGCLTYPVVIVEQMLHKDKGRRYKIRHGLGQLCPESCSFVLYIWSNYPGLNFNAWESLISRPLGCLVCSTWGFRVTERTKHVIKSDCMRCVPATGHGVSELTIHHHRSYRQRHVSHPPTLAAYYLVSPQIIDDPTIATVSGPSRA